MAGIRRYRGDAPSKVLALVIARRVCFDAISKRDFDPMPIDLQQYDLPACPQGERLAVDDAALLDELADDDRRRGTAPEHLLGLSYRLEGASSGIRRCR